MAKKQANKEVKRLKKKVKKLAAVNLALEKRIRKLERKPGTRKQQAAEAQMPWSREAPIKASAGEIGADNGGGVAASQRAAWKRHSYLRGRYESHLGSGATKERARQLANDDLKAEYGEAIGFTEDELSAILS